MSETVPPLGSGTDPLPPPGSHLRCCAAACTQQQCGFPKQATCCNKQQVRWPPLECQTVRGFTGQCRGEERPTNHPPQQHAHRGRGLKAPDAESVGLSGGLNILLRIGLSGSSLASLKGGSCMKHSKHCESAAASEGAAMSHPIACSVRSLQHGVHPVALDSGTLACIPELGCILVVRMVLRVRQNQPIHLHQCRKA